MLRHPFIAKRYRIITGAIITPELALTILNNYNKRNARNKVYGWVETLVCAIKNGHWKWRTGNAIKFDMTGMLIDGQHRLEAIAKAGIPVKSSVAVGCDFDAPAVIDDNHPRTVGQSLACAKGEPRENSTFYTRVVRIAGTWLRVTNPRSMRWDKDTKYQFYLEHKKAIDPVFVRVHNRKARGAGFRAACAIYFSKRPVNAAKFFHLMTCREETLGNNVHSAIWTLRKYFRRTYAGNNASNDADYQATAAAIHAFENKNVIHDNGLPPFQVWSF